MQKRRFGESGLEMSALGLGCTRRLERLDERMAGR